MDCKRRSLNCKKIFEEIAKRINIMEKENHEKKFWKCLTKIADVVTIVGLPIGIFALWAGLWQINSTLTVDKERQSLLNFATELFNSGDRDSAYHVFQFLKGKEKFKKDTTGYNLFLSFAISLHYDCDYLEKAKSLNPTPENNEANDLLIKKCQ